MRPNLFAPLPLLLMLILLAVGLPVHAVCTAGNPDANVIESTPTSDFTDNGNGTVTHAKTGLMWKRCMEGLSGAACTTGTATTMNWANALKAANTANTAVFAGYTDWRLPNRRELQSIVEFCGHSPSINQIIFPVMPVPPTEYFWSSSSYTTNPLIAWLVNFTDGHNDDTVKTDQSVFVRLVRGGQSVDSFSLLSTGTRNDFNGDEKSDILWRHTNGTNYAWQLDGAVINGGVLSISSQGLLPGVAYPDWSIAGVGDFNGDGKADILWRHTDGTNYVWHLDGSTINGGVLSIVSQGLLPGVPAGWSVAGIGDFNGDGKSDILWRHTNGTNYVWHIDGATINGGVLAISSQGLLPGVDATWSVAGVGDINGDGKADILWRRNDGTNYVWHIDGATINGGVLAISSQGLLPGVDVTWSVAGVGDFNGDGRADVLWRRNDGTNYVWNVNGGVINSGVLSIATQGLLPAVTDTSWSVAGVGDYNGDGKADVLWRHANGTNYVWHVDGATINGGVLAIPSQGLLPAVADMGWQVQNPK